MAAQNLLLAFNRGLISRLGLSRIDLSRTGLSAQEMTNWWPRVLGSMSLRPGMKYTGATKSNNKSRSLPFVFAIDDTARLEFTNTVLRVWVGDSLVTRAAVTAAVTNGGFDSNVTSWTDNDEVGATSQWQTGGYLALLGDGTNAAIRDQTVTVNEAGTEHALRVVIARGPVLFRVGSTTGDDDYVSEESLDTGTYSFAFTPTGNFNIRFFSREDYTVLVDSVSVEASGTMELPSPYVEADLKKIRFEQSGDVMFIACKGYQQRVISRFGTGSWGIALYEPVDGPFRTVNNTPITLTPSALNGDITLTASKTLFRPGHVGALFRIQSSGQTVTKAVSAENTFSDPILVTGIGTQRAFAVSVAGTFVATVTLQYSVSAPGSWVDAATYTVPTSTSYNDGLDNQIIYYRIGVKTGDYTSGTANLSLIYTNGSITGICRLTARASGTSASAVVLTDFGATTASSDWWEGQWSDYRGWPSAVALHEGRLWFGGNDKINGTISDDFYAYDDETVGDSGPIARSIGQGPVENINWLMSLGRLIVGTESIAANIQPLRLEANSVLSARSNSFDEPLTPTNFNMKLESTNGIFVDQSSERLMTVGYNLQASDYLVSDMTLIVPDIASTKFNAMALQKRPDSVIHAPLVDGSSALLLFDKLENVNCWFKMTTGESDGDIIEDVCVLPAVGEDDVYYTVRRTISGSTVRYHEKLASLTECVGGTVNKQADAFIEYTGAAVTTIPGLSHLEGRTVVVWGNGKDLGSYTVSGGQITGVSEAVTDAIVGLSYTAKFKSMKQALAVETGMALNEVKKINAIGLVLADTHKNGLEFGPDYTTMDALPAVENGTEVADDYVWDAYDEPMITFPGTWDTNAVVCLRATAPRPVTVLSVAVSLKT